MTTWKVDRGGYLSAYLPTHPIANKSGAVRQHRLLAYEAGLLTSPTLVVHHIDGNKINNALDNLAVITKGEHSREHDTVGTLHRQKTHCPSGHEYTTANTRLFDGRRWCRKCDNERGRLKRAQNPWTPIACPHCGDGFKPSGGFKRHVAACAKATKA